MRGGKRPGAGRPLGKRSAHHKLAQDMAQKVLSEVDTIGLWKKFLHCPQVKVAADCLQYLHDRAFGRPSQTIQGGTTPVRIEFSFGGTPEWLKPDWKPPAITPAETVLQIEGQVLRLSDGEKPKE